jgi:hypothetical protein
MRQATLAILAMALAWSIPAMALDYSGRQGVSYTRSLMHALYPEYGKIAWEFFLHYSRDRRSGEVVYAP